MFKVCIYLLCTAFTSGGPLVVSRSEKESLGPFVQCVEGLIVASTQGNCLAALPIVIASQPLSLNEVLTSVNKQVRERQLSVQEVLDQLIVAPHGDLLVDGGGASEDSRLPSPPNTATPSLVITNRPLRLDKLSNGDLQRVPEGPPIIVAVIAIRKSDQLAVQWREILMHVDFSNRFTILPLDYSEATSVLLKEVKLLVATSPIWRPWLEDQIDVESVTERAFTTTPFNHQTVASHLQYYMAGAGVIVAVGGVIVVLSTRLGTSAAAEKRAPTVTSRDSMSW